MFFEGLEKRVEVRVEGSAGSLRSFGEEKWREIVESAKAKFVSSTSTDFCDAYLLSESSLFIFDQRFIMITCGQTVLINAVLEFLKYVPAEKVEGLVYQRNTEVFPQRQQTSFLEDARQLNAIFPGRSFLFGEGSDRHLYLFHTEEKHPAVPNEVTLELLMYDLTPEAREVFLQGAKHDEKHIRDATAVREIIPGFDVDDHLFEPAGYSLNAISEDRYFTIHVTPQDIGSYASFETNSTGVDGQRIVDTIVEIFRPKAFDVIQFSAEQDFRPSASGYVLKADVIEPLSCGGYCSLMSFFSNSVEKQSAVEIPD